MVINPNNPTGAVYTREKNLEQIAELARKHQLMLLADEIYDKILYDDAEHISMASVAPDVLTLTFNGLSKAYRVAGYRAGWLVITGPPKEHAASFIEGISLLANMRLCRMCLPSMRFRSPSADIRASRTWCCRVAGCSSSATSRGSSSTRSPRGCRASNRRARCMRSRGSTPSLRHRRRRAAGARPAPAGEDPRHPGTGFNWPTPDHLRIVTLPWARDLANAIERLGNFLVSYRQ